MNNFSTEHANDYFPPNATMREEHNSCYNILTQKNITALSQSITKAMQTSTRNQKTLCQQLAGIFAFSSQENINEAMTITVHEEINLLNFQRTASKKPIPSG